MTARAFQGHTGDTVATLLDNAEAGPVEIIGAERRVIAATEAVARGHKIALRDMTPDESVIKLGARIGHATRAIRTGEWVHLHNLGSDIDARSGTLDLHSGAPTDTDSAYV